MVNLLMQVVYMYSIWAELASPLKTDFRNAFLKYSEKIYNTEGIKLTSYVSSEMGGNMPQKDYLINMSEEQLPECYVTGSFGECSSKLFYSRFLKTGIYENPQIFGYFPEVMVVDCRRLDKRPIPHKYEDLCNEIYKGEVCLIGSSAIPDPTAAVLIYRSMGIEAVRKLKENINSFAAPVYTIRHIGRSSNKFASVFIMPSLFAEVCAEKENVTVIIPEKGIAAEPMVFMYKKNSQIKKYIKQFLFSDEVKRIFETKKILPADCKKIRIDELCKKSITEELEEVFSLMK